MHVNERVKRGVVFGPFWLVRRVSDTGKRAVLLVATTTNEIVYDGCGGLAMDLDRPRKTATGIRETITVLDRSEKYSTEFVIYIITTKIKLFIQLPIRQRTNTVNMKSSNTSAVTTDIISTSQ